MNWMAAARGGVLAALCTLAALAQAGHEPDINPALRRFTGTVVGLGSADAAGHVHTLRLQPLGPGMKAPAPDELRGWRLTLLAGKRFASAFTVQGNSATEITVQRSDGPLDGVAASDVFVVEEPDPAVPAPVSHRGLPAAADAA